MTDEPPGLTVWMWKRFALATLIVVALTAATSATAALLKVGDIAQKLFPPQAQIHVSGLDFGPPGAAQTILVIGSDKRARAKSIDAISPPHSDTVMLVRMDPGRSQTSVLSIPRDLKVRIYGHVQKINAAYTLGGPSLLVATLKRLLHVPISHVVDINFNGFRRAVDAVGCVYADVDRRYYNDNSTAGYGQGYATINIWPGYQRMCGQNALDYVRYRHTDSDFVRVARQQDFVRQFKEQVGVQGVLDHEAQLEHAIGRSIHTDIHGTVGLLEITKLIAFSLGRPVRQVHFQSTPGFSYVIATRGDLNRTAQDFLSETPAPKKSLPTVTRTRRGRRSVSPGAVAGLSVLARSVQDEIVTASVGQGVPVYVPRLAQAGSYLLSRRFYAITDEHNHRHRAYRLVFARGAVGQYYGIQGMTWTDPPILAHPNSKLTLGGRELELFYDGSHLKVVAWRGPNAVYWISNTLLEGLSNQQMLTIAKSASAPR